MEENDFEFCDCGLVIPMGDVWCQECKIAIINFEFNESLVLIPPNDSPTILDQVE